MTEQKLLRTLRTVGMSCFIEYYELFYNYFQKKLQIQDVVEIVSSSSARKQC